MNNTINHNISIVHKNKQIDKYILKNKIGEGAYSTVYK